MPLLLGLEDYKGQLIKILCRTIEKQRSYDKGNMLDEPLICCQIKVTQVLEMLDS